jgi:pilus assembly protein TadC
VTDIEFKPGLRGESRLSVGVICFLLMLPSLAHAAPLAYIGPGAGLGMIGAVFAVLAFIVLALLGPILYPIRIIRRRMRQRAAAKDHEEE